MPGQLLRLRLLGSPSRLLGSPRGISVLGRAFPFKLKYSGFHQGQPLLSSEKSPGEAGMRAFSSGCSVGRRAGGARDGRRGGFRAGSISAQAKSLVDDEAELSDWISELKTDSFRVGRSSDSDDGRDFAGGGRSKRRGTGSRGRDSFRGGFSSGSDEGGEYSRGRPSGGGRGWGREGDRGRGRGRGDAFRGGLSNGREVAGEYSRSRSNTRDRFGVRDGERGGIRDGRGTERGSPLSRRSSGGPPMRGRDGSEPRDFNSGFERRQSRGSVGSKSRIMAADSESEEEEEDEMDFDSRKRNRGGTRGMPSSSSLTKRGKQDFNSSRLPSDGRISLPEISEDEGDDLDDEAVPGLENFFPTRDEDREETAGQGAHRGLSSSQHGEHAPPKPSSSEECDSYLTDTR